MELETILSHLSRDIGAHLKVSPQGSCTLKYENRIDLFLEKSDHLHFHLYAYLSNVPRNGSQLYPILMEEHLLGIKTHGAYFGVNERLNKVIYFKNFSNEEINYEDFVKEMQNFVEVFDYWQKRVSELNLSFNPNVTEETIPENLTSNYIRI